MTKTRDDGHFASWFETLRGVGGVVASGRGLLEVFMPAPGVTGEGMMAEMKRRYPDIAGANELTRRAAELLAHYFAGESVSFDLPVDDRLFTPFQREVYQTVQRIPYGEVRSYGAVAAEIGRPGAARGIGTAMARNPLPVVIPCHRVVGSGGALTGYSAPGGVATKKELLLMEEVGFRDGKTVIIHR